MRTVISLNNDWLFDISPANLEPPFLFSPEKTQAICLPHTWNAEDGQSGENYRRACCAYYRALHVPAQANGRFYLEFQAANTVCRAYLNDKFLGEHRGEYSTFRFDITDFCTPGGADRLTVLVDNSECHDVNPLSGDFTIFGGLYRDVNLICVPYTHFDLSYYGTQGVLLTPILDENGTRHLSIETHLINGDNAKVCYEVTAPDGSSAARAETAGSAPNTEILLPNPVLWNGLRAPALYTCTARVTGADGQTDEVVLTFGLRSFFVDPEKGFFLNGKHVPLRGVARHQDRQSYGNAVYPEQLEEDMSILWDIGANAVRLSHYQHPQHFYDLCDREGLVVWAEIPMLAMPDDEALMQNACRQLTELILQNLHHPSICFWGLQNEIAITGEILSMYRGVERLQTLAHKLDPNRLTTSSNLYCVKNNSPLNHITDVVAYNVYFGWYYGQMEEYANFLDSFHADNPDVPLGISEYGVDANPAFHSDAPHVKDYSEEFQCRFHETVYPILNSRPYVWGTFVWNLFDFGSAMRNEGGSKGRNCKGLVTYDRSLRKDAFYYYKAQWSSEPFVHINSRRYEQRASDVITVRVYSNQPSVSLEVDGTPFASLEGNAVFEFQNVPLHAGVTTVTARAGNCTDIVSWTRVDTPNTDYAYIDPNPGFNVKNWFTLGQSEEDLFPQDRYSLMDTIGDLMAEPRAVKLIGEYLPQLKDNPMLEKAKAFTLFKIVNRMSGSFDETVVQELNQKLKELPKT